ncbi:FAD-dependent monooxygenase [Streptomyces sp. ATCC51928]|uniref:FAD-dependent monooxygenase n=1 Tax=Streptomyces caviscabies TaxID=90079 RepID=A0ABW2MC42_9ACTN|nr:MULTISPECIES: FAD-dependent monooxygenase [unclassified Streptomyces]MDX3502316.1 FAD-dependent monooxygenase [Streptomyces sp. ATCC51928]MDX5522564.1 FAD-dependent monooxygenase [Streptomyces sp. DE06-01C]WKN17768.1 FAD-dependent monooxygenase [Streptomyces sp. JUS-F4]
MDPVIVVGAGPVGLTLSLALAAQGVPSVVLDEGPGTEEPRPARTVVLREDTADLVGRLGCRELDRVGLRWAGWRSMRRKQLVRDVPLSGGRGHEEAEEPLPGLLPSPLHVPQHALSGALRAAVDKAPLVQLVPMSRIDTLEQDPDGITVHTREPGSTWWRGSYLVGCDGARSTVRKLLDIRFPGRTAVERHAVAALRAELPWPDEAVSHRQPPWRTGGAEISARPLPDGVWRLDWLLPPRGELVTPEALITRIRDTLAGWCGETPAYELLDTGVHTLHHRLARRWRKQRAFLAGDAAHLLGALGTQGLDEGLRDAENLAWKLAHAWHHGPAEHLLDSYQAERRAAVAARLRAADQSLPILRGGGGLRTLVPGAARGHDTLLSDGHLGCGALGAPPSYSHSPLAPPHAEAHTVVGTPPGAPVTDVTVTAPDGTTGRLRERLGQGKPLVILVAPGTGVWDRRHWRTAGVMPRLTDAVAALPGPTELLVTESYPGASAHTVLLVRPDGHLVAAFGGVRPAELYTAAQAALGGAPRGTRETAGPEDGEGEGERGADHERPPRARVHADGTAAIT